VDADVDGQARFGRLLVPSAHVERRLPHGVEDRQAVDPHASSVATPSGRGARWRNCPSVSDLQNGRPPTPGGHAILLEPRTWKRSTVQLGAHRSTSAPSSWSSPLRRTACSPHLTPRRRKALTPSCGGTAPC